MHTFLNIGRSIPGIQGTIPRGDGMDYSNELDLEVLYRCALDYSFAVRNDIRASDFETDLKKIFLAIKKRANCNAKHSTEKFDPDFFIPWYRSVEKTGFTAMSDKQLVFEFRGEVATCWLQEVMIDANTSMDTGTPPYKVAKTMMRELSFLLARFSQSRQPTIHQQNGFQPRD